MQIFWRKNIVARHCSQIGAKKIPLVGTTAAFRHLVAPRANDINRLRNRGARKIVATEVNRLSSANRQRVRWHPAPKSRSADDTKQTDGCRAIRAALSRYRTIPLGEEALSSFVSYFSGREGHVCGSIYLRSVGVHAAGPFVTRIDLKTRAWLIRYGRIAGSDATGMTSLP